MQSLIEFENLGKRFSFFWAIKDATSTVNKNDTIGVIGSNGAGKTTLLYLLSKIYKPTLGKITYTKSMNIYFMGRESMVYESLTALENLKYFKSLYPHITDESFKYCLEKTGLYKFRHDKVENYSYGMLKRFLIARMLILKPDIAFLDEPFDGLDVQGKDLLKNIFIENGCKEIDWKYQAMLFVDHNLERCKELSNRIWTIDNGRFLQ